MNINMNISIIFLLICILVALWFMRPINDTFFVSIKKVAQIKDVNILGSFKDNRSRAMIRSSDRRSNHTQQSCKAACPNNKYFALQYGGECFCSNDYNKMTQYGKHLSGCNPKNSRVGWCNYVYENIISSPTGHVNPASPVVQIKDVNILGSFKDNRSRAMIRSSDRRSNHTQQSCKAACPNNKYFALQYGGECFCSNDYNKMTQYGKHLSGCNPKDSKVGWCNYVYENIISSPTDPVNAASCLIKENKTISFDQLEKAVAKYYTQK